MHRNFQGYTTHGHCDLAAMGITAISQVRNCYSQNTKSLEVLPEGVPLIRPICAVFDGFLQNRTNPPHSSTI